MGVVGTGLILQTVLWPPLKECNGTSYSFNSSGAMLSSQWLLLTTTGITLTPTAYCMEAGYF